MIVGSRGTYPIAPNTTIAPGKHLVIASLGDIFDPIGGFAGILDDLDNVVDQVDYGTVGGAPAPPPPSVWTVSLARAPDASNPIAPPTNPNVDALFWTIDLDATVGLPNDVPGPNLGESLCINEMFNNPTISLPSAIELCSASSFAVVGTDLSGWFVTTASGVEMLSGVVPAGGFLAVELDPKLLLGQNYRVDLFNSRGVRVYQKSFFGAPDTAWNCYGDCPDGAAPPDGWNYSTCGGGVTFFPMKCTLGFTNSTTGACRMVSGIPPHLVPDGVVGRTWGTIKSHFRE